MILESRPSVLVVGEEQQIAKRYADRHQEDPHGRVDLVSLVFVSQAADRVLGDQLLRAIFK